MMLLASLVGIGSLICWVMVLIRLFKAKGALHGSLGIKNIMLAWTACFVIGIPINFMAGAGAAAEMQKAIEEAQRAQGAATP